MSEDVLEDIAYKHDRDFDEIADELFEVDKTGIYLQAVASFFVASIASIGSHLAAGVDLSTAALIFTVTFAPNFGLKVVAELVKKRALVHGMQKGYKQGRKDALLSDKSLARLYKWSKVYRSLESATFSG